MAGINGGLVNITFNYIPPERRTTAIGLKFAIGGLVGFIASLLYGGIVAAVSIAAACALCLAVVALIKRRRRNE
jgi:Flp pilus assembly protein TadB